MSSKNLLKPLKIQSNMRIDIDFKQYQNANCAIIYGAYSQTVNLALKDDLFLDDIKINRMGSVKKNSKLHVFSFNNPAFLHPLFIVVSFLSNDIVLGVERLLTPGFVQVGVN